MTEATGVVRESRRIEAPATVIFQVLVDPARHVDIDGSEMVRGALTQRPITGVGDRFDMAMFSKYFGEYTMQNHVVEFEPDRRVAWAPAPGDDRSGGRPVGNPPGHLWRFELAPDGVGVTIAYPGVVATQIRHRGLDARGQVLGHSSLDEAGAMTVQTCARLILDGTLGERREIVMSAKGKLARWLKLLVPGLVDRIALKALAKQEQERAAR